MNKDFIHYEQAKELKELGFDEPCFGYWKMSDWLIEEKTRTDGYTHADQLCSAPTYSQALRWFREKYGIDVVIGVAYDKGKTFYLRIETGPTSGYQYFDSKFKTYEEAELACLIKMIEIKKK
jgi:hypothetical protein